MADTVNVTHPTFAMGDRVEKISGSSWRGHVVGTYSTSLTPEGYAVESETEVGSVQIYPAKALRLATRPTPNDDLRAALAWFSGQTRLSLQHYSPWYGDDDDQYVEWRIDRESGPINDREWETIARGETVEAAILAAHASALKEKRRG